MMTPFRTYRRLLLPALLLLARVAAAQATLPVLPLPADPARASYAPGPAVHAQHRTNSLTLPFFDDFTLPLEGPPKVQNWLPTGGTLVSNRLSLMPLTRGAATLDGLKADGKSYSGSVSTFNGATDSLTSQPIDLSGLSPNDHVYLSFAWQAGSIVGVPNRSFSTIPVRLDLYVKTNLGDWDRAWFYASVNQRTGFRQQVIDLNQAKYLHANFQFMFVATGNQSSNSDNWGVDYVLLNRGRNAGLADTTFVDIATSSGLLGGNPSGGLRSPLRRFTAMPVWQFNAAPTPTSELTPNLGVNINNLTGTLPVPVNVLGTVRDLASGAPLGTWLQRSIQALLIPRLTAVAGPATGQPLPATATPKILRYTLALDTRESPPRVANDTIFRDVEFNNYYAYDDGTAEAVTQLPTYGTGQASSFAYRIDLNRPDYVRSLRLYPVYTASDQLPRAVTVSVWDDVAGKPGAQPRASKSVTIPGPAQFPAGWQYYEVTFDQPVAVSGIFYVGYSQPSSSTTRDLHYGLDLNNSFPAGYLWRHDNVGVWDTIPLPNRRGALMMRPVMTNNVATATASAREAAAYSLYPNPAHGTVAIAGPAFAHATVLDALGRTVWEQPVAQAGQPTLALPMLPAGVYTVRLTLADGRTVGRRLMLE
ncbi:T9SS type A sorting domain-containing protein [Hymenobacter terricola]|uniref:T9SS type A sorting domain-containing protein n=1 Tax=Hymenobacter terricola TaxID=2819236 RepID=UPI001B310684|nr:T9SS type A sorting domain-containing protein [Hymenobacter terricola]